MFVNEKIRSIEAIFGVEDAFFIDGVVHDRFAFKAKSIKSIQASTKADLKILSWHNFTSKSNENLLFMDIEMEGRFTDSLGLKVSFKI